jgi:hypothetical protein
MQSRCNKHKHTRTHARTKARTRPQTPDPQGAKKIGFDEFVRALHMVAEAKGCDLDAVLAGVEACGGPAVGGATTPEAVRLYEDAPRRGGGGGGGGAVAASGGGGNS